MKLAARLLFFMVVLAGGAYAQDPEPVKGFDRNKLFFGGNFGLSFGNNTLVNISPQAGYRFNRHFAAGAGINALYSSFRTRYVDGSVYSKQSYGMAGLNVFGRAYLIDQLFLQAQPEANYIWGKYKQYDVSPPYEMKSKGEVLPSLLLGVGGAIPAGTGSFIIMAQYDVLQNGRTPYGDKIFFSFGYNIGGRR